MSIKMLVDAALRPQKPRPITPENLAVIRKEVGRLEKTVQEFLDFTRPPPCGAGRATSGWSSPVRSRWSGGASNSGWRSGPGPRTTR